MMEFNRLIPELTVKNMDLSHRFYVDILGFKVEYKRSNPAFCFLSFHGAQLMLEEFHEKGWNTGPLQYPLGRGINFQIDCSDVKTLAERVKRANHPLFREPNESWYEVQELEEGVLETLVQDPDGYLLRFSEHLGQRPRNL